MKHRKESIFAFGNNLGIYRNLEGQIDREEMGIKRCIDKDREVGNGHLVKLDKLRRAQRQALLRILKGLVIIAVGAGAAVASISYLDSCEKSAPQDQVSSIRDTISLRFNEEGLK
ncbi:hypothetical protein HZC21_06000 [Candidatus Peregrinibacteria bacterium]|nr:hypothetical protein [Candidatus Peregrinibacteria bacterium]